MSKSAYPTGDDLQSYLVGAGLTTTLAASLSLADAVAAGIADFERATGRTFLGGSEETRYFDPPTDGPLLWIDDLSSLASVVYEPSGGAAETLTENTDFRLDPYNAAAKGQPYTALRFLRRGWVAPLAETQRASLQVTGAWGWGDSFPDDVWQAMLARAAWTAWPQLTQQITGGRLAFKQADVSEDFGVETWTRLRDGWAAQYETARRRYRRWRL